MAISDIRQALETHLAALANHLPTAWENVPYTPALNTAYQWVWLLPAPSGNPMFGDVSEERGILQIQLYYPHARGSLAAQTEAQRIMDHFPRGLTLTQDGQRVLVHQWPYMSPGRIDNGWYVLTVSVPYSAFVWR